VKVYLLIDGKRMKKKKTATRKENCNPVWNEALTFNVSSVHLQNAAIEVHKNIAKIMALNRHNSQIFLMLPIKITLVKISQIMLYCVEINYSHCDKTYRTYKLFWQPNLVFSVLV
jgi:hypothetical protein